MNMRGRQPSPPQLDPTLVFIHPYIPLSDLPVSCHSLQVASMHIEDAATPAELKTIVKLKFYYGTLGDSMLTLKLANQMWNLIAPYC